MDTAEQTCGRDAMKALRTFARNHPYTFEEAGVTYYRHQKGHASPAEIKNAVEKYGPWVEHNHGLTLKKQADALSYVSRHYGIPPTDYYIGRLFLTENMERAHLYVSRHVHRALIHHLNKGLDAARLSDKWNFFETASRLQLAAAPVYAAFKGGTLLRWLLPDERLPAVSMFLKATFLSDGKGHEFWRYDATDNTWCRGGIRLRPQGLLARARARSLEGCYILQPALRNHPHNESLAADRLATLRVITRRPPDGAPALFQAFLRLPLGDHVMDHFKDGGLAAPVDVDSGTIGCGLMYDPARPSHAVHPETGAPLDGRTLAGWPALREACLQVHRACPEFAFLAFDAAATAEGPALLEVNLHFSTVPQLVLNQPWGATAYVPTVTAWLALPGKPAVDC